MSAPELMENAQKETTGATVVEGVEQSGDKSPSHYTANAVDQEPVIPFGDKAKADGGKTHPQYNEEFFSVYDSVKHTTPDSKADLETLETLMFQPSSVDKLTAPLWLPTLANGKTKDALADAMFTSCVNDLDHDAAHPKELCETMAAIGAPSAAYSTKSATEQEKRARVVTPYARPCSAERHLAINEVLADKLAGDECVTRKTQGFFAPNRGEHYASRWGIAHDSALLDPLDETHPIISKAIALQAELLAEELASQSAAKAKRKERAASAAKYSAGQISPLDAFNDANDCGTILESNGYKLKRSYPRWDLYLAPRSESGAAGVKVFKDGEKQMVYSHHSHASDPLADGKGHDAFDVFKILEHGGDEKAALKAAGALLTTSDGITITEHNQRLFAREKAASRFEVLPDEGEDVLDRAIEESKARRKLQQEENDNIQRRPGDFGRYIPVFKLQEMKDRFIYVARGETVSDRENPAFRMGFREFKAMVSASKVKIGESGKAVPTAVVWLNAHDRETVQTRTFRPGHGVRTHCPQGLEAVNSWRPFDRDVSAAGDVSLFLDQVAYLFPQERDREKFLDWLAHIEQKPGELPHYGWLHIATKTGTGRNWLASVLARVWCGQVAPNVDLLALLDGNFNDVLSERVLAMVDEVQAGGGESVWKHANKLKGMMNAETRLINRKFQQPWHEYNACRWLIFSNHKNALPLEDNDRRVAVVMHEQEQREPAYYEKLYAALYDERFINSVAVYLKKRDIRAFKPGERPEMSEAKRKVIDASKPEAVHTAEALIANHGSDIITNADLMEVMTGGRFTTMNAGIRHALADAGAESSNSAKTKLVKMNGLPVRFYILRNHEKWLIADPQAIRNEISRGKNPHFDTGSDDDF